MGPIDYASSGLDIQSAMVDQIRRHPNRGDRPPFLLWSGVEVKTSDVIAVPKNGLVSAAIRVCDSGFGRQGFDLQPKDGFLELLGGEKVKLLRTWHDERYEDRVSYRYVSKVGLLAFWNVYLRPWPDGKVTEEKWTGNAGFWVEEMAPLRRVYHCSSGRLPTPDFESLVVEVSVEGAPCTSTLT